MGGNKVTPSKYCIPKLCATYRSLRFFSSIRFIGWFSSYSKEHCYKSNINIINGQSFGTWRESQDLYLSCFSPHQRINSLVLHNIVGSVYFYVTQFLNWQQFVREQMAPSIDSHWLLHFGNTQSSTSQRRDSNFKVLLAKSFFLNAPRCCSPLHFFALTFSKEQEHS